MIEIQQPVDGLGLDLEENARIGYQAAVGIWIAEGEQTWARFNTMYVLTRRDFEYQAYLIYSACEIEERYGQGLQ